MHNNTENSDFQDGSRRGEGDVSHASVPVGEDTGGDADVMSEWVGSHDVPVGEWTAVPAGMVAAPGTYVDEAGVLRSASDDSMVVWHWRHKDQKRCERKGFTPTDVVYLPNGAPWCPECLTRKTEFELSKLFGQAAKDILGQPQDVVVPPDDAP